MSANDSNNNRSEQAEQDFDLIVDYMGSDLTPDQMDEVERRLDTDPEFRELAIPLMQIRNCRLDPEKERAFLPPPRRAKASVHSSVPSSGPRVTVAHEPPAITLPKFPSLPLFGGLRWRLTPTSVMVGTMAGITTIALGLAALPGVQEFVMLGHEASANLAVLAASAETREFTLANGANLVLRPKGAISYDRRTEPATGFFHLVRFLRWGHSGPPEAITLNGFAAISVPDNVEHMDVVTTAGLIRLVPGVYRLQSTLAPARGVVMVLEGRATLVPLDPSLANVTLDAGEFGELDGPTATARRLVATPPSAPASGPSPSPTAPPTSPPTAPPAASPSTREPR